MASKEQYEFFRFLYEEEERRYAQLEARAKLYLSVIALFLATLLFKAGEVRTSIGTFGIEWNVVVLEAALLIGALILVVIGAMIRTYEGVADGADIVNRFGDEPPSNDDFFDDRIADFVVATQRNQQVNDRAASYLSGGSVLLAASMVVLLVALAWGKYH